MSVRIRAVKGRLFNKDYYLGNMTFAGIDRNVLLPDNKHWDGLFGDTEAGEGAQRRLNEARVKNEIVPYLVDNQNAFFSAITLIMVPMGGKRALVEERDYRWVPDKTPEGTELETGELEFEDHVLLFPADGMHRSAAITEALVEKPELSNQRVSVVMIPYESADEVRQLFADLNRTAKPVSATVALNFEIRDPVVILSKRLGHDVPLFRGRINTVSNSLPAKSPNVIALNTLKAANEELLAVLLSEPDKPEPLPRSISKHPKLQQLRGAQPGDMIVDPMAAKLARPWMVAIDAIPEWKEVLAKTITPGKLRDQYVFAHGVGWQAIAHATAALMAHRPETWEEDLSRAIRAVNWRRGPHWNGIAMVGDRMNNTGPGIRATAGYILEQGGFKAEQGTRIASLLKALETSRTETTGDAMAAA